jgi:hypothetical protein
VLKLKWVNKEIEVHKSFMGGTMTVGCNFLVDSKNQVFARVRYKGPFNTKVARIYTTPAPMDLASIGMESNGTEYYRMDIKDWVSMPRAMDKVEKVVRERLGK